MQFIVTKQIAVEAETPEEAVAKITEGNTISLNVTLRPQQAQPIQTTTFGSRGQGSQLPSHMQISPTPTTTGTQPTNG